MIGAVPAMTMRAMLAGMRAAGLDTQQLVDGCGLRAGDLWTGRGRVPDSVFEAIWRKARVTSGVEGIGVVVGSAVPIGMFGPVDYLASSAATLAESIASVRDFGYLTSESSFFEIENGPAGEGVVRVVNVVKGEEDDVGDEFVMGLVLERLAQWAGAPVPLVEVQLTRRQPSRQVSERLLGRVSYGHACSQIVFGPGAACVPLKFADPYLHSTLRALLLEAGKGPAPACATTISVRNQLRDLLSDNVPPSLAIVSRDLGVSQRTLQRRLMDEGSTFGDVLDDLRRESALSQMRAEKGRSILEIALSLGFADERALSRAFRRWTGSSPRQWRKRW